MQKNTKNIKKSISTTAHYSILVNGVPPRNRPQHFIENWKKMTTQTWPLSVIQDGYKIQFNSKPISWTTKTYKLSESDQQAVNKVVDSFLKSKVIERSPTQDKRFLSQFFTIKEPNKIRPILDCRKINQFIQCNHFKMEGVPALRDIVEKDDFLTKIDLKDAYIVVPIHPESWKFLSFSHKGTVYQYRSLTFGQSVAPHLFSKLMRHALEPLRAIGIRLVYYPDDICVVARTKEEMEDHTQKILTQLTNLGFLIDYEKSDLIPKHVQDFLGFTFNTKTMKISIPQTKILKLISRTRQLQKNKQPYSC